MKRLSVKKIIQFKDERAKRNLAFAHSKLNKDVSVFDGLSTTTAIANQNEIPANNTFAEKYAIPQKQFEDMRNEIININSNIVGSTPPASPENILKTYKDKLNGSNPALASKIDNVLNYFVTRPPAAALSLIDILNNEFARGPGNVNDSIIKYYVLKNNGDENNPNSASAIMKKIKEVTDLYNSLDPEILKECENPTTNISKKDVQSIIDKKTNEIKIDSIKIAFLTDEHFNEANANTILSSLTPADPVYTSFDVIKNEFFNETKAWWNNYRGNDLYEKTVAGIKDDINNEKNEQTYIDLKPKEDNGTITDAEQKLLNPYNKRIKKLEDHLKERDDKAETIKNNLQQTAEELQEIRNFKGKMDEFSADNPFPKTEIADREVGFKYARDGDWKISVPSMDISMGDPILQEYWNFIETNIIDLPFKGLGFITAEIKASVKEKQDQEPIRENAEQAIKGLHEFAEIMGANSDDLNEIKSYIKSGSAKKQHNRIREIMNNESLFQQDGACEFMSNTQKLQELMLKLNDNHKKKIKEIEEDLANGTIDVKTAGENKAEAQEKLATQFTTLQSVFQKFAVYNEGEFERVSKIYQAGVKNAGNFLEAERIIKISEFMEKNNISMPQKFKKDLDAATKTANEATGQKQEETLNFLKNPKESQER